MNNLIRGRNIALILILVLLFTNTACLQLKEIREFTALAGSVGDRFPGLVNDLYDSCLEQQRYQIAERNKFRIDKIGDLNDETNPVMAPALEACAVYKNERERLIKANATLVSYLKSMGDLAADDLTNFDKNIEGFGGALTGAKLLNDTQSTAVINLGKFLTKIVTEGYRRKKLKSVIKSTNADIQIITSALSSIVRRNYILQLENERVAMRSYYFTLATQEAEFARLQSGSARASLLVLRKQGELSDPDLIKLLDNSPNVYSPIPLDELKTKFEAKNASLNTRIRGAEAYAKILDNVAAGHQKLYDNADKLSSREVLSASLSYAKTIKALAADFEKAF